MSRLNKIFVVLLSLFAVTALSVLVYISYTLNLLSTEVASLNTGVTYLRTRLDAYDLLQSQKVNLERQGLLNINELVAKEADFSLITSPKFNKRAQPPAAFADAYSTAYDYIDEQNSKGFTCAFGILVAPEYEKILLDSGVPYFLEFDGDNFYNSQSYVSINQDLERVSSLGYCWLAESSSEGVFYNNPDYTIVNWISKAGDAFFSIKDRAGRVNINIGKAGGSVAPLMFSDNTIAIAAVAGGGGTLDVEPVIIDVKENTYTNLDVCANLISRSTEDGYDSNCFAGIEGKPEDQISDYGFVPVEGLVKVEKNQN